MLEKENGQGLNVQRDELIKVCAVVGYSPLPTEDCFRHFVRSFYPSSRFPRFHLKVTEKDTRLDAELHLDIRPHRGRTFGVSLSEELERLVETIDKEENSSIFATQLLAAFRSQALFGTSDAKKRREIAKRILVARIKGVRMKKENRARLLNRRYSLDEHDQLDLE